MNEVAELEREVEAERARLDASITALQRRMSPAGLADETLALVGRVKPHAVPDVRRLAQENPLGMLLVGLGLGLIIWRASSSRAPNYVERPESFPRHANRRQTHDT